MSVKAVFVRSAYNYDMDAASLAAGQEPGDEPSKAHQSFRDECDINTIVKRFGLTGELPETLRMPVSGDFTEVVDFHGAMEVVRKAQEEFLLVPADIRARFNNDPGRLIAFLEDGNNLEEARKLGFLKPVETPPRDVVTAVDELASKLTPPPAKA